MLYGLPKGHTNVEDTPDTMYVDLDESIHKGFLIVEKIPEDKKGDQKVFGHVVDTATSSESDVQDDTGTLLDLNKEITITYSDQGFCSQ